MSLLTVLLLTRKEPKAEMETKNMHKLAEKVFHVRPPLRTDPGEKIVYQVREGTALFPDTRKGPVASLATEGLANLLVEVLRRSTTCKAYCPLQDYLINWASLQKAGFS